MNCNSKMLKPFPVNQGVNTVELSEYQKQEFQDELLKLESIIGTLSSMQKSQNDRNDDKRKHIGRLFSLQKLRIRRMGKKEAVSTKAERTEDDIMERVNKLQNVCNDLSERLKAEEAKFVHSDSTAVMNMPQLETRNEQIESRDDDILGREDDAVKRASGDRTEILEGIKACAKILSKFAAHPQSTNQSVESYEMFVDTIEMTESRFLENQFDSETREDDLLEKDNKLIDEIEMTESQFLLSDESEEKNQGNIAEFSNESEVNHSTCYGFNDCWIIEAIETLLAYFFVNGNSAEEESISDTTEDRSTNAYFCGMSQLWNAKEDEEPLPDDGIANQNEVSNITATSTVATQSGTSHIEHPKSSLESLAVADSKLDTLDPTTLKRQRADGKEEYEAKNIPFNEVGLDVKEETKIDDGKPLGDVGDLKKVQISEEIGQQKQENNVGTEVENTISLNCDFSSSMCLSKRANTELNSEKNSDHEDEIVTTTLDCGIFDSLSLTTREKTKAEAGETPNENKQKEELGGEQKNDQIGTKDGSKKGLEILDLTKAHCVSAIVSMDMARRSIMDQTNQLAAEEHCVTAIADCVDIGLEITDSASNVHGELDERIIKTITSMDFIPRIEVIGHKKSQNEVLQEGKKTPHTTPTEIEDSREDMDEQQIRTVSTMDFIPRFEVVGFKNTSSERTDESKSRNAIKRTSSREGAAKTKFLFGRVRSKKSESQPHKISHKEYRRKALRERREQRRTKHLSKQLERSNVRHLGTIQEAPEQMEQSNVDSVTMNEKVESKYKSLYRDTPETLVKKSLKESPPPLMLQEKKNHQKDVRKAPSAVQLQGTEDTMSALTFAGHPQVGFSRSPVHRHALIDIAPSSLTTWTGNKSYMAEVNIKDSESRDDSPDAVKSPVKSPTKMPWFFQSLQVDDETEEKDEVVHCLSTVLSIPAPSSFGSRIDSLNDNEYVNHYYDFGDEETVDKDNEYYDDEYDHDDANCDLYKEEEEEEAKESDCYVCDSYQEESVLS